MKRSPMKRTRKKPVPAEVRRYWDTLPDYCQACHKLGVYQPGEHIHHILADAPGKQSRRDHMLVVKLDHGCHNGNRTSVHGLGSEAAFEVLTGVDLVEIAVRNRDEWLAGQKSGFWISEQERANGGR